MKKYAKHFILLILTLSLIIASASCGNAKKDSDRTKILCTVFPVYDWVRSIVGDSDAFDVSLLVENGTDLHSFQPSFGDMAKIKDSDIVIYIGGESDKWVAESIDERAVGIELSGLEGMTLYAVSADSIAHAHEHGGEECHEEHDHSHGFDEHIWLSPKNASAAVSYINNVISEKDAANAEKYAQRAESYKQALMSLERRMSALSESISAPLVFCDRFPLVYLFEDYGIDYFAAFEGCTTDTGADFDTVITLAKKIDSFDSRAVFTTESPVEGLAASIIAQTQKKDASVVALDSMQSLGKSDIESGKTYITVMEENIARLEEIYKPD